MQLHFKPDKHLMGQIQDRTNISNGAEIARNGIELLAWATQQVEAGRQIQAFDPSGNHIYIPSFPALDQSRW